MRHQESIGLVYRNGYRNGILTVLALMLVVGCVSAISGESPPVPTTNVPSICAGSEDGMLTANVVSLDQPLWNNRLGASMPSGMIFALERDVCVIDNDNGGCKASTSLRVPVSEAGNVMLKPYKRPRPMTLRVNRGQCLRVNFKNLLSKTKNESMNAGDPPNSLAPQGNGNLGSQQDTRRAGVHVQGMEWVKTLADGSATLCADGDENPACNDGSWVGHNPRSVIDPGTSTTYTVYAAHEGTFILSSVADNWTGAHGDGGTMPQGLFGALHVQPGGAEYYRSQVTREDLKAAQTGTSDFGQPLIGNYMVDYKTTVDDECFQKGQCRVGPVLSMLCSESAVENKQCVAGELVHSDLTAIMTGPGAGRFQGERQEPQILDNADERMEKLGRYVEEGTLGSSYALPDRLQPYREFTIMYHDAFLTSQAFSTLYTQPGFEGALTAGGDFFGFNYGMGGIGSEILANRFKLGPMGDCTACKYEEFFLTSWAVGDPAMVVDKTADSACTVTGSPPSDPPDTTTVIPLGNNQYYVCDSTQPGATMAYYPDDPSNVYHSYLSDHTKFRIAHGAADLHHLHHQHAHQWMHSPDTSNGDYTDSQSIGPGSSFTLEMVYNGSGNVNQTVGDSIFHCHFYPHFAAGMWGMWRVHDVYETGTELDTAQCVNFPNCAPKKASRALPDGEMERGTPIPAVVPMPTIPMPPMPSKVRLATHDFDGVKEQVVEVLAEDGKTWIPATQAKADGDAVTSAQVKNPGFPFFIPGVAGQRAPHPPLDFAYVCQESGLSCVPTYEFDTARSENAFLQPLLPDDSCEKLCDSGKWVPLDGGLPRHVILGEGDFYIPTPNSTDYTKELESVAWLPFPDEGTIVERSAMRAHATRAHGSVSPRGLTDVVNGYDPSTRRESFFLYNGLAPVHGAPYADPCIQYSLEGGHLEPLITRQYLAADIQIDATFNKQGWHFPQQRMITLWGDVEATMTGERPPEPFFFRSNSEECIDYTLANLVPNLYELDDFQVRTPTDILGQHIHLVKFDVTSSDGATNGFNYEDGTLAPNEVTERIRAINKRAGEDVLTAKYLPFFGPGPGGQWMGAQATIQRWWADPLLNRVYRSSEPIENPGVDRTLRTVFTHDHFGPSTHQQAGLYAGLVIEPHGSDWYCNDNAGFCGENDFFNPDPNQAKPFGGSKVGNVELDGKPISVPARIAQHWDYGVAFNGTPPAVDVNDGGPTSWQAVIETHATCERLPGNRMKRCVADSNGSKIAIGFCRNDADCAGYREFMFEMQDSTLTYEAFQNLPSVDFGGYCSNDTSQSCTPATASTPAKGCDAGAVCYRYGFCSTDTSKKCQMPNSMSAGNANDPSVCPVPPQTEPPVVGNEATCNLVAGVPSFNLNNCIGGKCYVSQDSCQTPKDCPFVATWDTGAISNTNQPELITLQNATFNFSTNYRNEPLFPRLNGKNLQVLPGEAGDSSSVYRSIPRPGSLVESGTPPNYPPLTPDVGKDDPFTPLLRAYAGDDVQFRVLVGAHINPHNFTIQGFNWLMEPAFVDSGWRASQVMGISEHFEMLTQIPSSVGENGKADYLYMPGAAAIEQAAGSWGLIRSYGEPRDDLRPLPQNPEPKVTQGPVCDAPTVHYDVVAVPVKQAFRDFPHKVKERGLYYTPIATGPAQQKPGAWDPNAILYIDSKSCEGFPTDCKIPFNEEEAKQGTSQEYWQTLGPAPLVLRAPAGACMTVTLHNFLEAKDVDAGKPCVQNTIDFAGSPSPTLFGDDVFNRNKAQSCTSTSVGLHPQLVSFNTTESNGFNVGTNAVQTAAPGENVTYTWYAGHIDPENGTKIPVEFGAGNLIAADPLNQWQHALYGGVVIEPADWDWRAWRNSGEAQGVSTYIETPSRGRYREHVVLTADGLSLENLQQFPSATRVALDQAYSLDAFNFHSPIFDAGLGSNPYRLCDTVDGHTDLSCVMTTPSQGGLTPPVFPAIFDACAGEQVRFHFLHPGGINTNNTMEIFGHVWSEAPYVSEPPRRGYRGNGCVPPTMHTNLYSSGVLGDGNDCRGLSRMLGGQSISDASLSLNEWQGSHMGHGPQNHMTFLLDSAGGVQEAPGDYLIRSYPAMHYRLGMWGIFRVNQCAANEAISGVAGN